MTPGDGSFDDTNFCEKLALVIPGCFSTISNEIVPEKHGALQDSFLLILMFRTGCLESSTIYFNLSTTHASLEGYYKSLYTKQSFSTSCLLFLSKFQKKL